MRALEFVIYGLATFRLTRLLTRDQILSPLRERFWQKFSPETTRLGYLSTCEWCLSIWAASLLLISSIITAATDTVATVLALSAVAGLLAAHEDR